MKMHGIKGISKPVLYTLQEVFFPVLHRRVLDLPHSTEKEQLCMSQFNTSSYPIYKIWNC